MKQTLLIVGNKTANWKSWDKKLKHIKSYFSSKINFDITLKHIDELVPYYQLDADRRIPTELWTKKYLGSYDFVLFVLDPSEAMLNQGGFAFGQIGVSQVCYLWAGENTQWNYPTFSVNAFESGAVHELFHAIFKKWNLPDSTHYHWDRNQLEKALLDIPNIILIVHHTGTPRDTTSLKAILADHNNRYGRAFYQCFITPDGVVHWNHNLLNTRIGARSIDYCLVGNFVNERPTEAQLESLNVLTDGKEFMGHKDAVKRYGATPSECPGKLLVYLKEYRGELSNIQVMLQAIGEQIKALFKLKK